MVLHSSGDICIIYKIYMLGDCIRVSQFPDDVVLHKYKLVVPE